MDALTALRDLTTREKLIKEMAQFAEGNDFIRAVRWTRENSEEELKEVKAKDVISAFHKETQNGDGELAKLRVTEYMQGLKCLSETHQRHGYLPEAVTLKEEEILLARAVEGKSERFYESLIKLAVLLKQSDKEDDALDTLRYVYKGTKSGWPELPLKFWNTFAGLLYERGEYKMAVKCFEEVYSRDRAAAKPDDVLITDLRNLVAAKLKAGMNNEAAHTQEELLCLLLKAKAGSEEEVNVLAVATESKRLGDIYTQVGKHKQALVAFQSSLSGYETLKETEHMGETHLKIGNSLLQQDEHVDALQHFKLALKLYRMTLDENDLSFAPVFEGLSKALKGVKDYDEAMSCAKRAFALRNCHEGLQSPNTALCQYFVADLLALKNRPEEALPLLRAAIKVLENAKGGRHYNTALCYNRLALILGDKGAFKEAMNYHLLALDIDREHFGSWHKNVATDLSNLAALLTGQGEYEEALPVIDECLEIRRKLFGGQHESIAIMLSNKGCVLRGCGRYEEAEKNFLEAIDISKNCLDESDPEMAIRLSNIAELYLVMEKFIEADVALKKALQINVTAVGSHHPRTGVTLHLLGELLCCQDLFAEAKEVYSQVLDINTSYYGRQSIKVARDLNTLGQVLIHLDELASAEELLKEALEIRVNLLGRKHQDTGKSMEALALLKLAAGDKEAAAGYGLGALAIYEGALGDSHPLTEEARIRWF